ncbi:MAG: nuclear transport factor 2 family protein [Comamonadaceae bacterium]|nr:MAG: nuclear transport factor 2 family protein [Comamonadaceae bacterium]
MHTLLTLPDPIAAYFLADRQGPDQVAECFTPKAVVKNIDHIFTGRDAIRAWKKAADAKYTCTTEPFALELIEGVHAVKAHVAGNFKGSPLDMKFFFRLVRGLIANMEVTV